MVKRFARQNRTTRSSRRSWTGRAFAALLACALGAALAVGPVGCAGGEPDGADVPTATATSSFTAMDTGMTLTVHAASQAVADDAANACRQRVLELDELLTPENAASEIARANAAGGAPTA
ncbi:MAG: FAD:protein FMN transferase, partial [Eggerthella lenta]